VKECNPKNVKSFIVYAMEDVYDGSPDWLGCFIKELDPDVYRQIINYLMNDKDLERLNLVKRKKEINCS